ncbi:cytochrome P450, partial [Lophium mytilinum]
AKGKAFQVLSPESLMTIVSSPKDVRDIALATNDQLSLHAAAKEILQPEYTMNGFNWHDQRGIEGIGFVRTLRTLLTQHLPQLTPGTRVIIERTFADEVGRGGSINGNICLPDQEALSLVKKVVTKISGLAFFGRDRMEDDAFMDAAYYYNEDVLYGAEVLRLIPQFLVPVVGKVLPLFLGRQRTFYNGLVEMIEERVNAPSPDKKYVCVLIKNDVIQWIIDTSPKSNPWSPGRMAFEVMAIWFGSVQGLATTLTFALFNLSTHPEYIQPLREEMESPAGGEFFVKGEGLPLMDSFLKESSRWTPVESVTTRRCALKDFTFSNGTHVEKGNWICIPVGPMLRDASYYPQPDTFNGFRFASPELVGGAPSIQPEGPSKFTDISDTWQVWGTGRITCPGRYFVSYVMKHIMVHILENYEPEMVQKTGKHTLDWRTLTLPRPGVKVDFKPRA